jgi:RNA polymerase sigma-70 factor, ECF subfamily
MEPNTEASSRFDAMYRTTSGRIRRYLARAVGGSEAEDLVHEVYAKALTAFGGYRGESSAYTWLYRIATNVLIDSKRRERAIAARCELADRELFCACHGDYLTEEYRIVEDEMKACICSYIKALPIRYRTILILREYEAMSIVDIASVMGLSEANARKTLTRARNRLRKDLSANCSFSYDESSRLCCDKR